MGIQGDWFIDNFDHDGIATALKIRQKCVEIQSPFQTIAVYETTRFGYLMTIDDVVMLTSKDNFLYHEMLVHPALFTHPNPKNVAIIGGGDCGTLKEVLKHPVSSCVQIEIDEAVTKLAEQYFPELCVSNSDPRAELLFIDGIDWMQKAAPGSLDVIIVDSTDPQGPALGLFNKAFYQTCFAALKPNGILVHQSESPILHQSTQREMRAAMNDAGFNQLLTIPFPQPVYPSGLHSCTLAGKLPILHDFRKDRALLDTLQTKYYQFAVHEAALTPLPFMQALVD